MNMYEKFKVDENIIELSNKALEKCSKPFKKIDENTEYNQLKVLSSFTKFGVSESHFAQSTGYGYGDSGRDLLEKVFAEITDSEDSLIRHNFTCGTHTLAVALFGILRPGDTMLCVTGTPYDTIHSVIGLSGKNMGSLKDFGVTYKQVDLLEDGTVDFCGIEKAVKREKIKMVYIQRSRGYSLRPSLSVEKIGEIVKIVKENSGSALMKDPKLCGEIVKAAKSVSPVPVTVKSVRILSQARLSKIPAGELRETAVI